MAKSWVGGNRRILRRSSGMAKAQSVRQSQLKAVSGKNKKTSNKSGIVHLHYDGVAADQIEGTS